MLAQCLKVDLRGLIVLSMPLHVEVPGNGARLATQLQDAGLHLVALSSWHRDRCVVTTRSRRVTNAWEPVAILCRSKDWHMDRDGPARPRKGAAGREEQWDEDTFETCAGDFWAARCDRRDRRLLPAALCLHAFQLAGLGAGNVVLDPWGNPGVRESCEAFGLQYRDGGLPNALRADWARSKGKGKQDG